MINIKKIKPLHNSVITTAEKYEEDQVTDYGLIKANQTEGTLKEYQRVTAVGPTVRTLKVGDFVKINPARFAVRDYGQGRSEMSKAVNPSVITGYNFPILNLDGVEYLDIAENDIAFIIEEWEEVAPKKNTLIIPEKKIITT